MKKKKWNKLLAVLLVMADSYITFVRLWQEECGKRRCRNNYGVFMEHKAV